MTSLSVKNELPFLVKNHLASIYPDQDHEALTVRLLEILSLTGREPSPEAHKNYWSEEDIWMIAYGDSIRGSEENKKPLTYLRRFLNEKLSDSVNGVHILPFFPYSSDDGFSVINYCQVNDGMGDWSDIQDISKNTRLMADLVINHCSSRSQWFEEFKQCKLPGKNYFIEASPEENIDQVVRPRTSSLLREVETLEGKKHVWCTFSHDQVDVDFSNPDVLCEFVEIIKFYLDFGVTVFRLDAVAFLWKELGTSCIHLPQTHAIIRLLRTLIEHHTPGAILITETNVPNHENLSYFGNANEAHAVYNFSLPPLVLQALVKGTSKYLKAWQMSMPPAQEGTFYLNFLASHDGIGLRPVEGLLQEADINELVKTMQSFGARISWRSVSETEHKPYEINVTFFDALKGTVEGKDGWQIERFLCAHAIMLALEGVPAIYVHSFIGTKNDYRGVELTQQNRSINRHKWNFDHLIHTLEDESLHHHRVFNEMQRLCAIRRREPAFHPNAVQFTLHIDDSVFGFWRQSQRRDQSIFCLHNVTNRPVVIPLSCLNLISLDRWADLITGSIFGDLRDNLELPPYGFIWLTNKLNQSD